MDIIWIGVAFLLGFAASRIHLPPLVGYLAAGLTLAAFGYEGGEMLDEIAHLGVLFLLFTVGLHIRLKNIIRYDILGIGVAHLIISTAIFTPISLFFGYGLEAAIIISITLGFSSTVLTAKNLERRNELGALYGRAAIGILIIQDLVAIAIIAYTGGGMPSIWGLSILAIPLFHPLLIKLLGFIDEDEVWMLFGLALALGGASLFEYFNLSGELGALGAGMLLASDERADQIGKKMWGVKEAFLVGFFLDVGLTGFPSFSDYYYIIVVLLFLPVKTAFFYLFFMVFKYRARTGYLASISLTAFSEFTLIAGAVASQNGFIPESTMVILGLITAISYAINAPISINEEKIWKKWEDFLLKFEREGKHPEHQAVSLGSAEYLIVGMGNAGRAAYDKLKEQGKPVVGMDIDPDRIQHNLESGRRVVYGDIQDTDLWTNIDLGKIKSVMIAMGNQDVKENATRTLRTLRFEGLIYVLTMREEEAEIMQKAGASAVSIPIKEAGEKLAELSAENDKIPTHIDLKVKTPKDDEQ
ncbi:cation:proton antiporter family protein [Rhodohalobacter sp.]|uniref:cation:proton antiporter family protein n=1 Tax=Rhodohalobacter sp. TaxID=1974210 RepID=UPI002ACE1485|nr:cation:proton antiporter family protein [Rhodohalobacter sp.]MDZ7758126.1 cation:proton antiporter family protein [Rhodohalobacter sp.]